MGPGKWCLSDNNDYGDDTDDDALCHMNPEKQCQICMALIDLKFNTGPWSVYSSHMCKSANKKLVKGQIIKSIHPVTHNKA